MVLKTFNVQEDVYERFSKFCKEHGISMSKQIVMFMESMLEDNKVVKQSYLKKLERIRKGKFHKFNSFPELKAMIEND